MKKVLFATTALVASAGIASADVTFTGKANAGLASENGNDFTSYSEVELDVALAGSTDNGLSFGASVDLNVGTGFDMGDDEFDTNTGVASLGSIFVSGAFGKITIDKDGIDDQYDDDNSHDVAYDYSVGGVDFGLTYDVDEAATGVSSMSVAVAYSAGAISAGVTGNDGDNGDAGVVLDAGYTVNEALSLGIELDSPAAAGADSVMEVSVGYSAGGLSLDGAVDDADGWSAGFGYAAGSLSLAASTDSDDEWEVTADYDLGGGASVSGGMNHNESAFAGVSLAF